MYITPDARCNRRQSAGGRRATLEDKNAPLNRFDVV